MAVPIQHETFPAGLETRMPDLTPSTLAARLRDLVAEAEDAGLPPVEIALALEDAAAAIREAGRE